MRFNYNDEVEIISGFYKGYRGFVKAESNWLLFRIYLVSFIDAMNAEWINAKDLRFVARYKH